MRWSSGNDWNSTLAPSMPSSPYKNCTTCCWAFLTIPSYWTMRDSMALIKRRRCIYITRFARLETLSTTHGVEEKLGWRQTGQVGIFNKTATFRTVVVFGRVRWRNPNGMRFPSTFCWPTQAITLGGGEEKNIKSLWDWLPERYWFWILLNQRQPWPWSYCTRKGISVHCHLFCLAHRLEYDWPSEAILWRIMTTPLFITWFSNVCLREFPGVGVSSSLCAFSIKSITSRYT